MGVIKDKINKGMRDLLPSFSSLFEDDLGDKEDYLKKLKKNGATPEELEKEAAFWDRAHGSGGTKNKKSKEEPVKKFRGGLMRKPKLAKRGF